VPPPVDPLTGSPLAIEGHVVTMDERFNKLPAGVVYLNQGAIVDVRKTGDPPPEGFEDVEVVKSGGTIFPGLIELHNHLSYNALRLWDVPELFTNRDKWSSGHMQETYRKLISGPMSVLGKTPGLVEAVVRFVEAKCLVSGVTTSQGIALFSNSGIGQYYEGVVRNVERTYDDQLHGAETKIADVEAKDAQKFLTKLGRSSCLLLHLSEGTDTAAHEHFEALHLGRDEWAITPALAGIHCVALTGDDFAVMAEKGGSMIWSPLSNLLLYGKTADFAAAKSAGVRMGLGSDWSPSGSKNLLGELKVARLADPGEDVFSDAEVVALATRSAAQILGWESVFGSLEAGKRADLFVLRGRAGDPYRRLLTSSESDVELVLINGVPRYGAAGLMERVGVGQDVEALTVGQSNNVLFFRQETADPIVGALSLAAAQDRLSDALDRLPELAHNLEHPSASLAAALLSDTVPHWMLVLDHEEPAGLAQRPHLPGPDGAPTAELTVDLAAASVPLSELLGPLSLDELTVSGDGTFLDRIAAEMNLPAAVKDGLPGMYT
jgi:5-methylthioadenosine/S-adenosylhomocysteine deaminase